MDIFYTVGKLYMSVITKLMKPVQKIAIGIGRSLTAPPSHTTQHTGPNCAVRLVKTDTDKTMRLLGLGERNATGISASAAQYW